MLRFLLLLLLFLPGWTSAGEEAGAGQADKQPDNRVELHFFWSSNCPHCQQAQPFVAQLERDYPWLRLRSYGLGDNPAHAQRYQRMAAALGETARSVPAFFICDRLYVGFDHADGVGAQLRQALLDCRAGLAPSGSEVPELPAGLDPQTLSLPLFTLTLAALDAFNPCAFFVLLFLLSLMVNARNRRRMLLIGGVFVLVSGLLYFLFMAAWLELFLLVGAVSWVTLAAGFLALLMGGLNIKDYFLFRQGPSLSLSDSARRRLFGRMRALLSGDNLGMMLLGTLTLALAANSYELLCTAGFPMVYTRVLTLQAGSDGAYYAYLLLYNLIYITPLLLIVLLFTLTMGRRKLSEQEGKGLKLLSGIMMTLLGLILLFWPEALNSLYTGVLLLLLALGLTWLMPRLVDWAFSRR
ncbi:MAG: thioredoxin family protein [Gammaproteobacteria bacterium SHHR-1]|uniref:thioredoxin family protein n=1 Tax=Magnetovirga frankeli TaxID=947516 RepID=UPI00327F69B7